MTPQFTELIDWLFEYSPEGWFGQIGGAGADKVGRIWLPGANKHRPGEVRSILDKCSLFGATQLAYEQPYQPMNEQDGAICWCGLDIDAHDNRFSTDEMVRLVKGLLPATSIRTSSGGHGLHVIIRLLEPIITTTATANLVIRDITRSFVERLATAGIAVCKSDRRMFWLVGGANQWVYKTDLLYEYKVLTKPEPKVCKLELTVTPGVKLWIEKFQKAGLIGDVKNTNLIYVGDFVKYLREQGYKIETKSRCSGNGQRNGYLDVRGDQISVWSYADGHKIWSFEDLDFFVDIFKS